MYKSYCGRYISNCNIQKSIRIDKGTYEIIQSVAPGESFSEQVRQMAYQYDLMKKKKPGKK